MVKFPAVRVAVSRPRIPALLYPLFFAAALLLAALPARASWTPALAASAIWNDNITNAAARSDRLDALHFDTSLALTDRAGLSPKFALTYGGEISAETYLRYGNLDVFSFGPTLTLTFKPGLGPYVAVYALRATGTYHSTSESARTGPAGHLTFTYTERLDEPTQFRFTADRSRVDARSAVFSRTATELSAEIIRDVGTDWTFVFAARWRRGDVLSYATPPRPDLVSLASIRQPNTTFDRSFVAYSLEGTTIASAATFTRALSQWASVHFGLEWRETTRHPLVYINRVATVGFSLQF